jgi:hypothetical protein
MTKTLKALRIDGHLLAAFGLVASAVVLSFFGG